MDHYNYKRRESQEVTIGNIRIGGSNEIALQSMTNTSTMDTQSSVSQIKRIADAGAHIVRLTAQGERESRNLKNIKEQLHIDGYHIPLVADIHFNPKAAFAAAEEVEKVRINPGNFVDPGRTFKTIDYSEEEYQHELNRLKDKLVPFYELCRNNNVAVRIGVNHGSLSDRIMSRYGDTPAGMVESAMEFLRIAKDIDFKNIVLSIKASNTRIMVETVRLLVETMDKENMNFPLHLGVTEAGDAEDGRIKSAVGIGTLLSEGIGDTIRVSLSEDPVNEIPVASELVEYITSRKNAPKIDNCENLTALSHPQKKTIPIVIVTGEMKEFDKDAIPDYTTTEQMFTIDYDKIKDVNLDTLNKNPDKIIIISVEHPNPVGAAKHAVDYLRCKGLANPVIINFHYSANLQPWQVIVRASADYGPLLIDRYIDGLMIDAPSLTKNENARLAFGILQGTRSRITKTEYIACPGCGRTLFELSPTLKKIKEATNHLKGLKIGVMGCIVNGPGEMADADYGYVGAGTGKISLYKGKECVMKNLPQEEAVDRLIDILKQDGKWIEK